MTQPTRSLRLQKRSTRSLDTLSGSVGEIFYDSESKALRLYTESLGRSVTLADRTWVLNNTFDGNYSSLTNVPTIPSVNGLATETFVTDAVAGFITIDDVNVDLSTIGVIGDVDVATTPLVDGQILQYDGVNWVNTPLSASQDTTYALSSAAGAAGIDLKLTDVGGNIDTINLLAAGGLGISVTALNQITITGSGLATETYVGTAISNLIDTAPEALDTLNELAAALGDDANFAGTVTTSLGLKAPLESPVFTGTITIPLTAEVVTPPFHPAHLAPAAIVEYRSSDDPFVGSTGTVTDTRGVVYHTIDDSAGAANWTANFRSTLLPTTAWSSKSFAIVCSQGSTNAWLPTAVQIGGVAQTIQWQGNIPPTGTVNGVDIISFTFIRRASDWLVLGSGTSYS